MTHESPHRSGASLSRHGMPDGLAELGFRTASDLWPPWCMARVDGDVASIAHLLGAFRCGRATACCLTTGPAEAPRCGMLEALNKAAEGWRILPAVAEFQECRRVAPPGGSEESASRRRECGSVRTGISSSHEPHRRHVPAVQVTECPGSPALITYTRQRCGGSPDFDGAQFRVCSLHYPVSDLRSERSCRCSLIMPLASLEKFTALRLWPDLR
jgi:hypothetical protein